MSSQQRLSPHTSRNVLFLGANGIGVDGRGGELRTAEPFPYQVERDPGRHCRHSEAMPKPLGWRLRPVEPGCLHDRVYHAPHTAGETRKYEANVIEILMENLHRLWRGETVLRNGVV